MRNLHSFKQLVSSIRTVHQELAAQAGKAINISLTLRNWLIGCHIAEYEQNGNDRAEYGEKLLDRLSAELNRLRVSRCGERELRRYRQFYQAYPHIRESLPPEFKTCPLAPINSGDGVSSPGSHSAILLNSSPSTILLTGPFMKSNVFAATGRCGNSSARSAASVTSARDFRWIK